MAETKTKAPKGLGKAIEMLTEAEQLTADAEALMVEHGISEMLAKAADLKKKATEWAVKNEVDAIPVSKDRYYGLRRDTYNKRVIGDTDELSEVKDPTAVIPLKAIIKKKFGKSQWVPVWKQITTRRVDIAKLESAVAQGILTVEEITPAYYHDTKSPYLRAYGKD